MATAMAVAVEVAVAVRWGVAVAVTGRSVSVAVAVAVVMGQRQRLWQWQRLSHPCFTGSQPRIRSQDDDITSAVVQAKEERSFRLLPACTARLLPLPLLPFGPIAPSVSPYSLLLDLAGQPVCTGQGHVYVSGIQWHSEPCLRRADAEGCSKAEQRAWHTESLEVLHSASNF